MRALCWKRKQSVSDFIWSLPLHKDLVVPKPNPEPSHNPPHSRPWNLPQKLLPTHPELTGTTQQPSTKTNPEPNHLPHLPRKQRNPYPGNAHEPHCNRHYANMGMKKNPYQTERCFSSAISPELWTPKHEAANLCYPFVKTRHCLENRVVLTSSFNCQGSCNLCICQIQL